MKKLSELVLVLVVIGAVGFGLWYLLSKDLGGPEVDQLAVMKRLQASAQVYHSRLWSYDGICSDIGVPPEMTCEESDDAYVIQIVLDDGAYYCIDSTGFIGPRPTAKASMYACN